MQFMDPNPKYFGNQDLICQWWSESLEVSGGTLAPAPHLATYIEIQTQVACL